MNTGALFQLIPIYEIKKIPRFFMYIRAHRLLIPINQIKRTGPLVCKGKHLISEF